MNANDATLMMDALKKANKDKTGSDLLTEGAPSPNEIWATVVAVSEKIDALQEELQFVRSWHDKQNNS